MALPSLDKTTFTIKSPRFLHSSYETGFPKCCAFRESIYAPISSMVQFSSFKDCSMIYKRTAIIRFICSSNSANPYCFQVVFWITSAVRTANRPTFFIRLGNCFRNSYCMIRHPLQTL